jgi:SAM-dependent methyltransferase
VADEHPGAEVTGVDLSPIQPAWLPPNVKFIIDDAENDWVEAPNSLDYIHLRHMCLTIKDMPRLLAQAYAALKPGGWIETQDFLYVVQSDDNSIPADYGYAKFVKLLRESFLKSGFDLHGQQSPRTLEEAGFVNSKTERYKVPIGAWPRNPSHKKAGMYNKAIVLDFLPAAVAPFTRGLGWTPEEYEAFLVGVRKSVNDPKIHAYYTFHMTAAQKPK